MEVIVKQTYRFIVAGIIATLITYLIFAFSYLILNLHYILSSMIGFLIVSLAMYQVRKRWVFRDTFKKKNNQFIKFMILEVISLTSGIAVLYSLTEFVLFDPLISQFFTLTVTAAINFLGNKYIIF
jgi:putative flippase GtrA